MKANAVIQTILLVVIVVLLGAQNIAYFTHIELCKAATVQLAKDFDKAIYHDTKTGADGKEKEMNIMDQTFRSGEMLFAQQIMLMKGCEK